MPTTTLSKKRIAATALLSLAIFILLFILFHILRFFYWSPSEYHQKIDRSTWHHVYTKTTFQQTPAAILDQITRTNTRQYAAKNPSISHPCTADLQTGYWLPPFPFLKFETGGCRETVVYYVNYTFAVASFLVYGSFGAMAASISYAILLKNQKESLKT